MTMTGWWSRESGTRLDWRRLRYRQAEQAARALQLLVESGAPRIELRLPPDDNGGRKLLVGMERRYFEALERGMSETFGLLVDPQATAAPALGSKRFWRPGTWGDALRLTSHGTYVAHDDRPDLSRQPGAPLSLPPPAPGLGLEMEMPFPPLPASTAASAVVWNTGEGGLAAPAGLLGDARAIIAFLHGLARLALLEGERPTVVLDGDGQLVQRLRKDPALVPLLTQHSVEDLSLAAGGQTGFNPLAEAESDARGAEGFPVEKLTLQRWRFWMRGLKVFDEALLSAAYRAGVRSVPELEAHWRGRAEARVALHNLQGLTRDRRLRRWLSGEFDLRRHLRQRGHVVVDCSPGGGPVLQAARGLVALAAETEARLLTVGIRWPKEDDGALVWLDTLCAGRRWETTALARCTYEQAEKVSRWFPDPVLRGYLPNLPDGFAIVNQEGQWWTTQLTHSGD